MGPSSPKLGTSLASDATSLPSSPCPPSTCQTDGGMTGATNSLLLGVAPCLVPLPLQLRFAVDGRAALSWSATGRAGVPAVDSMVTFAYAGSKDVREWVLR